MFNTESVMIQHICIAVVVGGGEGGGVMIYHSIAVT